MDGTLFPDLSLSGLVLGRISYRTRSPAPPSRSWDWLPEATGDAGNVLQVSLQVAQEEAPGALEAGKERVQGPGRLHALQVISVQSRTCLHQ